MWARRSSHTLSWIPPCPWETHASRRAQLERPCSATNVAGPQAGAQAVRWAPDTTRGYHGCRGRQITLESKRTVCDGDDGQRQHIDAIPGAPRRRLRSALDDGTAAASAARRAAADGNRNGDRGSTGRLGSRAGAVLRGTRQPPEQRTRRRGGGCAAQRAGPDRRWPGRRRRALECRTVRPGGRHLHQAAGRRPRNRRSTPGRGGGRAARRRRPDRRRLQLHNPDLPVERGTVRPDRRHLHEARRPRQRNDRRARTRGGGRAARRRRPDRRWLRDGRTVS